MTGSFSYSTFVTGVLAAFVGFGAAFAIVVQGLSGVGASAQEAASGLMAVSVAMGLAGIILSLRSGMPISVAWSTPGAAFLATLAPMEGGFAAAVGAFIASALLVVLAGFWKSLGRAISAIPSPIANAMLAGVLLPLCLAPFEAVANYPSLALPVVLTWAVVTRINRLFAVPAAVAVAATLIAVTSDTGAVAAISMWSKPSPDHANLYGTSIGRNHDSTVRYHNGVPEYHRHCGAE